MNYLSYSKLSTYNQCPFKYKWIYLDNKEFPKTADIEFGTLIHSVLEYYFKYLVKKEKKKDLDYVKKIYDNLWNEFYSKIIPQEKYEEGLRYLTYCNQEFDYKKILSVEGFAHFYLSEVQTKINLKFDRIDEVDKETIKLIDYKTGNEKYFDSEDLQIIIYSYAIQELYPFYKNYQIEWIYLDNWQEAKKIKLIDKQESRKIMVDNISKLLQEQKFEPQKNQFCKWCYIRKIGKCDLWINY